MNHAGLRLVKDEIDKALEREQCPRCRSTFVKDRSAPGPRGTWRFKVCSDCDLVYDQELDA